MTIFDDGDVPHGEAPEESTSDDADADAEMFDDGEVPHGDAPDADLDSDMVAFDEFSVPLGNAADADSVHNPDTGVSAPITSLLGAGISALAAFLTKKRRKDDDK